MPLRSAQRKNFYLPNFWKQDGVLLPEPSAVLFGSKKDGRKKPWGLTVRVLSLYEGLLGLKQSALIGSTAGHLG